MSYSRQYYARQRTALQEARFQAAQSRAALRARLDPAVRIPSNDPVEVAPPPVGRRAIRDEDYVFPPTLGLVGLGLDMMFAPKGASPIQFSTELGLTLCVQAVSLCPLLRPSMMVGLLSGCSSTKMM